MSSVLAQKSWVQKKALSIFDNKALRNGRTFI